jgi:hypothetical protein
LDFNKGSVPAARQNSDTSVQTSKGRLVQHGYSEASLELGNCDDAAKASMSMRVPRPMHSPVPITHSRESKNVGGSGTWSLSFPG